MTNIALTVIRFLAAALVVDGVCSILTDRFFGFYNSWGMNFTKESKSFFTRITGILMMFLGMLLLGSELICTVLRSHPTAIMKLDLICVAVFVLITVLFAKITLKKSSVA